MKKVCIWQFIISLFLSNLLFAQLDNDSISVKKNGSELRLRIGIDIFQPIISHIDKDISGLEIVSDFQIKENLYISSEIGTLTRNQQSELINFKTSGSYIKIGGDFNMYKNWTGMNNQIYLGVRLANSLYKHNINNYVLFATEQVWDENIINTGYKTGEIKDLNAQWIEFLVGLKVQVIRNIYMGFSLRLNRLINNTSIDDFGVLFIPGFNRVTDDNIFGSSFNYTISYSIPFRSSKTKNK
ncbi:MAG: hypothetical protein CMC67_04385 [Flavobacteriaceae bacterium]|nr:hypothetical protein [Flavobacteriaceae bacterium]|tara:strand:- start:2133 stop:2855 length:723 start_codon:yes stop_codon:yes gene_type:complete